MPSEAARALGSVARIAGDGDNLAIAVRRLPAGTLIEAADGDLTLSHDVLEGHRFAIAPIPTGAPLLSWGLPFGVARRDVAPGAYVCNRGMLEALRSADLGISLPAEPNFVDHAERPRFDPDGFAPAPALPRLGRIHSFHGFRRPGGRGVGTRNHVVVMAVTSRVNAFVRQLAERLDGSSPEDRIDGVTAVAHTEGGSDSRPNNLDLVLRTLAGFMMHPNVGAVLAVDDGAGAVTNEALRAYMESHAHPLSGVPHAFMSRAAGFAADLARGERMARPLLAAARRDQRSAEPVSQLTIALQCGGSDAFSGISGNPLVAWVARALIRQGASAILAETDELIGAERYLLQRVRDADTAARFLSTIERFEERAAWHGASAAGNPSWGNRLRGLYNITLKSLGAALKRHPDVRLEDVLEYGERLRRPGFVFMDSPGNDLESIAGQVASGCNLVCFVTGNGSITNFPFVPTLKVVTTTGRYASLEGEMDVDAGRYLTGTPMDELGAAMLALTLEVASGRRTAGERAGHAQVQIWRDWPRTDATELPLLLRQPAPTGVNVPIATEISATPWRFTALRSERGCSSDAVGLILPTSLCAGQVARLIAEDLDRRRIGRAAGMSRILALPHTEGCGVSSGSSEELYVRTLFGYLMHPLVRHCLLLEHGCEKTHNGFLRSRLEALGVDPTRFGWASIQADGGVSEVAARVEAWFAAAVATSETPVPAEAGLEGLRLGIAGSGPLPADVARCFARLTRTVVGGGGAVVVAENAGALAAEDFLRGTVGTLATQGGVRPTLAYGQRSSSDGFHVMQTPTRHWIETLTGLGATGVEIILSHVDGRARQGHPLVPVLQVGCHRAPHDPGTSDLDLVLSGDADTWTERLLARIAEVLDGEYRPRSSHLGNTDFQFTRGPLGISL